MVTDEAADHVAEVRPERPAAFQLGDALTLTLVTAAAYVGAFGYEAGLCMHFSIPAGLIRISPEVLISALLPVLGFTFVLVLGVEPLALPLVPPESRPKGFKGVILIFHVVVTAVAIALGLGLGYSRAGVVTFLLLLLFADLMIGIWAGFAFLWRRWGATRWPRLATAVTATEQGPALRPFAVISRYVAFRHVALLLLLPLCFALGALSGSRNARVWNRFYSIPSKSLIIIRHYGDLHACKPWNPGTDFIGGDTIVLTTSDIANVPIALHKFPAPPAIRGE